MKEELRKPGSERADTRQVVRLAGLWALGGLLGQLVRRLTLHREVRGSNPRGDKIRTAAFRGSDLLGLEKYSVTTCRRRV